jgi:hypothetical protein
MPAKTKKTKTTTKKTKTTKKAEKKPRNKTSKRILDMWKDPNSVWGKNKPLENFWRELASGKKVVVVYKDGKTKSVNLPKPTTKKSTMLYNEFESNKDIVAVLSSNMSQDAYEVYLYPKARDNSVEYVIKNYKKYFKPMSSGEKIRVPS